MIEIIQSRLLLDACFPKHGFTAGVNFSYDAGEDKTVVQSHFMDLKNQLETSLPL
ncbi:MAG: hypothetical protein JXR91_15385 [Deltaproteobacteria bacterium]|nr:hypothetical protein [Deltaproteobacteria bacterium]